MHANTHPAVVLTKRERHKRNGLVQSNLTAAALQPESRNQRLLEAPFLLGTA